MGTRQLLTPRPRSGQEGWAAAEGSWVLPPQIMLLETARRYNHETECITFLKDFTYSKDDFHRAGRAGAARRRGVVPV